MLNQIKCDIFPICLKDATKEYTTNKKWYLCDYHYEVENISLKKNEKKLAVKYGDKKC